MLAFKESRASALLPYASGNNITDENSYRRYFLPRIKITNYNIEIDGRNFYDQPLMIQLSNTMKLEKYQQ